MSHKGRWVSQQQCYSLAMEDALKITLYSEFDRTFI
jgi:hypothetical protein